MSTRVPKYGLLLLFPGLVIAAACDRAEVSATAPSPTSAVFQLQSSFIVEPATVRPELLHTASCVARPAFGARISIIVRGAHDVIVRGVRFRFTDRFGATAQPEVIPIPSLSSSILPAPTIPTSSPIPIPGIAPLPGTSPIPIPGASPVDGLFIPAGTPRRLPFFLRFGCSIVADGILRISIEAGDASGRFETSEFSARLAS